MAALAMPGSIAVAAASATAQARPASSLVRPRLRLFGWAGASFMCVLPPREGWWRARPGGVGDISRRRSPATRSADRRRSLAGGVDQRRQYELDARRRQR